MYNDHCTGTHPMVPRHALHVINATKVCVVPRSQQRHAHHSARACVRESLPLPVFINTKREL